MCRRAVSLVLCKPVLRIEFIVFAHERVAVHLCKDARRADAVRERVAFDDILLREVGVDAEIPVRKHDVGNDRELFDAALHAALCRL